MSDVMKYESVLPENFDGIFRFTNWSDEDFIGRWNSKEYLFPAKSMVPMVMPDHSPLEIQHIRKKFAKDLAEREFYKSSKYKGLADQEGKPGNRTFSGIHQAATYSDTELEEFILKGLEPMEEAKLSSKPAEKVKVEDKLHRNEKGELITTVVDKNTSLREKALNS